MLQHTARYMQSVSQNRIHIRKLSLSPVYANWKSKLRPIYPNVKEKSPLEAYTDIVKSKKGLSADITHTMPQPVEFTDLFTYEGLRKIVKDYKIRFQLVDQRYIDERVDILGYDLAAAHFIVYRGGKVRFKDSHEMVERNEDFEYDLPSHYNPDYLVEEIDISHLPILYDGLMNLDGLGHLKTLHMSHCPKIDDWCMDRICGQFADTLQELDISHCPLITGKGLETLGRLRKLKYLNISGLERLANNKLICYLLEDATPGLKIEGADL